MSGKRLTTKDFIEKAVIKHGNRYDYSKVKYTGVHLKVDIICNNHGLFSQEANVHLRGANCPKCSSSKTKHKLKLSTQEFIQKAVSIHGSRYDYSLVEYVNNNINVEIVCKQHGKFLQQPNNHLSKKGCNKCADAARGDFKKSSTSEFIKKSKLIHKNKYDYSKSFYTLSRNKIIITCYEHGDFHQVANAHLSGKGCPKCSSYNNIGFSRTQWISHCNKAQGATPKVYIIRCFNENEEFIKIGITSRSIYTRFKAKSLMPYSYEVIKEIKGSPDFIFNKEKELHKTYKDFKYMPLVSFGGETECFNMSTLGPLSATLCN